MSEANRTFGRESGNIANPSKSENCQDNFRDLQKDLVVLRDLMLLLTSQAVTPPALLKGEPLGKIVSNKREDSILPYRLILKQQLNSVGVGAFDDPLLSVILLKASPFRRGGRVADGEVKSNIKTRKTTKSFCRS